ncbi:MAG: hypothetical protein K8R36_11975 [Planctomycetales bacterium]|nr:hypothetical protein [Planctomycetales bacterium]
MPRSTPDKVIVTNLAELEAKYGPAGRASVEAAVNGLIAADATRGIVTMLVDLNDAGTLAAYGFAPIPAVNPLPLDPVLYKDAIDKVYTHFAPRPAYLMLLGSIDVVPHIPLCNLLKGQPGDPDMDVPSDLPYACDAPYSTDVQDFIAPARVVGRLPNVTGDTDPAYLVCLLDTAAAYTSRPAADYSPFLGISAQAWETSTDLSLDTIFGTHSGVKVSPRDGTTGVWAEASRLSHFVNCHGATGAPYFYGKTAPLVLAHSAATVGPMINKGTVMTAECCYGAELYNPGGSLVPGQNGMCNTYLGSKAYVYFGSTNTSYGGTTTIGTADLICQLFFKGLISGASAGWACLQARLDYVLKRGPALTTGDWKTLAQFNLMADPSLKPVASAPHAFVALSRTTDSSAQAAVERHARQNRRATLAALSSAVVPYRLGKPRLPRGKVIVARLQELAAQNEIEPPYVLLSYPYLPPIPRHGNAEAFDTAPFGPKPKALHVIMKRLPSPPDLPFLALVRLIEAIEYKEALDVQVLESR